MAKASALVLADAHLKDTPDEEFALRQAVEIAIDSGVEAVISAGDSIDRQRNRARPIAAWSFAVDRLHANKIRFYFIEGQHELDDPPWLSVLPAAVSLDRADVVLGGAKFYGLSYRPPGVLQEELDQIPGDADIVIAHQVWAEWMGDVTLPQGSFADVPHAPTVVSGDYHKYRSDRYAGKSGQALRAWSPGATCQRAINEPHEHFVLLLVDGGLKRRRLRSRPFIDWPVMVTGEDLDRFVVQVGARLDAAARQAEADGLPEAVRTPRLRFTYASRLDDAVRRVEKAVAGRALLYPKEIPPEEKTALYERADAGAGPEGAVTPLSELPAVLDPEKDPEAFRLAAALLESCAAGADPAAVFAKWRADYLAARD